LLASLIGLSGESNPLAGPENAARESEWSTRVLTPGQGRNAVPEAVYRSALAKLYEAAIEPVAWAGFLDELSRLLDAKCCHYLVWDEYSNQPCFGMHSAGSSRSGEPGCEAAYSPNDPRRKLSGELDGKWILCREHFDEEFVEASELRERIPEDLEGRRIAGLALKRPAGLTSVFDVLRDKVRKPFGAPDVRWLERIHPHLEQASRLHLEVEHLRRRATTAESVLHALGYPVLVVDEVAEVRFCNAAADDWLCTNGQLATSSGVLYSKEARLDGAIRGLVRRATRDCSGTRIAGTLRLPPRGRARGEAARPYSMIALPLPSHSALAMKGERPLALLLVVDVTAHAPLTSEALQTLFSLTPAEARLALSLAQGKLLEQGAAAANVSLNTAKTQLRAILEKTGVHRQADLIRLIFAHPRLNGR